MIFVFVAGWLHEQVAAHTRLRTILLGFSLRSLSVHGVRDVIFISTVCSMKSFRKFYILNSKSSLVRNE